MSRSLEIRWFFDQPPFRPEGGFGDASREQPRTDWYAPASDDGCGIKTRGGKLETKLRTDDRGAKAMAGLRGRVEGWRKWSLEVPPDDEIPDDLLEATGWTAVWKMRYVRFFAIAAGTIAELDEPGEEGCQFEWAELRAAGRSWWTVGFEAYGESSRLESYLAATAAHSVVEGLPTQAFGEGNSFGYPRWLRMLRRASGS